MTKPLGQFSRMSRVRKERSPHGHSIVAARIKLVCRSSEAVLLRIKVKGTRFPQNFSFLVSLGAQNIDMSTLGLLTYDAH